jgi:hypothetical protein
MLDERLIDRFTIRPAAGKHVTRQAIGIGVTAKHRGPGLEHIRESDYGRLLFIRQHSIPLDLYSAYSRNECQRLTDKNRDYSRFFSEDLEAIMTTFNKPRVFLSSAHRVWRC